MVCCLQGQNLYSTDAQVFLTLQANGILTLVNSKAYGTYGLTPASIIWQSQSSSPTAATPLSSGFPAPFSLVMQEVQQFAPCSCLIAGP